MSDRSRVGPHLVPDPTQMPDFNIFSQHLSTITGLSKMAQMEATIAHLKAQKQLNYAEAAKIFEIEPTTLRRRFLGLTAPRAQRDPEHRQRLNIA